MLWMSGDGALGKPSHIADFVHPGLGWLSAMLPYYLNLHQNPGLKLLHPALHDLWQSPGAPSLASCLMPML